MKNSDEETEGHKLQTTKKTKEKRNSRPKEWQSMLRSSREAMTQECMCSICMGVIVHATISNPCGHVFCASCILSQSMHKKECPNCRARMTSRTRCRQMDTIINAMAMRGEYRLDDFVQYLKRSDTVLKHRKVS